MSQRILPVPPALAALLAGALLVLPAASLRAAEPSLADTSVVLNIYDLQRTEIVQRAVDALAPLVRTNDIFLLVSGNHQGTPNIELIAEWGEKLHRRFPQNALWTLTSGRANVQRLAGARGKIPACVTTIVYDYEPKWDNEPEFDPDFAKTVANFTEVARLAHGAKFQIGSAPTGRPLLQNEFARYGWDYGKLARDSGADGMVLQTQTYCKKGMDTFKQAIAKLKAQQIGAGLALDRVYPQLTVDLETTNGATPAQAVACVRVARAEGFTRFALWFAPPRVQSAVDFLKGLGR